MKRIANPKDDTIKNFDKLLTYFKTKLPVIEQYIPYLEESCNFICQLCHEKIWFEVLNFSFFILRNHLNTKWIDVCYHTIIEINSKYEDEFFMLLRQNVDFKIYRIDCGEKSIPFEEINEMLTRCGWSQNFYLRYGKF
jgi:hypothetical protein